MSDPKPFASLSPSLLARKGGARPAMRPQLAALYPDALARQLHDDLGWNDMGHDPAEPIEADSAETGPGAGPAEVVPISAEVADAHQAAAASLVPAVVRQQQDIVRQVAAPRRSALARGARAAFTLRVDAERHLKLRLACTIRNRSAQQLVTEALDRLLDELPEVASLAAQVTKKRH